MVLCEVCQELNGSYCGLCKAFVCEQCKFKLLPRARTALNKLINHYNKPDYRLGIR